MGSYTGSLHPSRRSVTPARKNNPFRSCQRRHYRTEEIEGTSLRERNESLSILHQFTLDLLDRREMDDLLQAIVDRAADLLDAPV